MATTFTSTAYSAEPKFVNAGVNSVSFAFTVAGVMTASANACVIFGPKIPAGSTILQISGSHSTGAASCPTDIGIDATPSAFASQVTQGTNAITAKTTLPFLVSVTDTSGSLYGVVKLFADASSETTGGVFNYTVFFTADP